MTEQSSSTVPIYEITPESIRAPWLSRSLRQLLEQRGKLPRRNLLPAAGAASVAVLIHSLLLGSIVYGASASSHARRSDERGIGSQAIVSSAEPVMTLILLSDNAVTEVPNPADEVIASRGLTKKDLSIVIASPNPLPAVDVPEIEDKSSQFVSEPVPVDDAGVRAALFQRYTGQIQARIERAWMRPRRALASGSFHCQVRILQDPRGYVIETDLQRCNGTTEWQLSLVQAIQSASPLPAPPNPAVFADALTLAFESSMYQTGGDEEGFERPRLVAQASFEPLKSLEPWLKARSSKDGGGGDPSVIELRIVGSPAGGSSTPVTRSPDNRPAGAEP
jgi:hypothetical protein